MAAVLFIVTIPKEAEEERLKSELLARNSEFQAEQPAEVRFNTRITTIPVEKPELEQQNKDTEEVTNAAAYDMPTTPITTNVQYGTYPKRRKLQVADIVETDGRVGAKLTVNMSDAANNTFSLRELNVEDSARSTRKSWDGFREILSSSKRKAQKKPSDIIDFPLDTSMELVVRELLKKFHIKNDVWNKDAEDRMHQIIFTVEFDEVYENILDAFQHWGIGERPGSTVSVMDCVVSNTFAYREDKLTEEEKNNLNAQKRSACQGFMNSVRSRLNVVHILRDVIQDAAITFDFLVLLISAAILAAFGLIENSTIFLASSMLISPLMGPIIAAIFGTVIKRRPLYLLGLRNELLGILIATLVGFIFALIVCAVDDRYGIGNGLSEEMLSRCDLHSLLVGVFTAIPSGAAAAIGILGGNIGSLVGVAISASLLPPAVNSGLLWALACVYKFFETDETRYSHVVKSSLYSNNQATELAILGSISMCLTILNIICIYIMGILVLKAKEIAPIISETNQQFWKHDIKIARDRSKDCLDTDNAIMDEYTSLPVEDQQILDINCEILRNLHLESNNYQNTWSPVNSNARHILEAPQYEALRENYLTVHSFEQRLYTTITRPHSMKDKRHKYGLAHRHLERNSDIGTSSELITENPRRRATMPTKVKTPNINIVVEATDAAANVPEANTPTGLNDEQKRRKFVITPAAEDPLKSCSNYDEFDV